MTVLSRRGSVALLWTLILVVAQLGVSTTAAHAAPRDFYTPPTSFDATPGSTIRSERMNIVAAVPKAGLPFPIMAQRVMYTSRTQDDQPVAVTGTYIEPISPWHGTGSRPTVVIAPGTQGQGDQCAPSRAFATGVYASVSPLTLSANQELFSASYWHSAGARVLVTDYIGLGTPGVHTYVNRVEQAHAVLDAARAANRLSNSDSRAPIALWGYSQGGGATAAAAELASTYAPELNIRAVWAGGPTADLQAVLSRIDGNLIGAAVGFAINGFVARNPELRKRLPERLTPAGTALLQDLSQECTGDIILKHPFVRSSDYTRDHRSLQSNLASIPEAAQILAEQKIGLLRPTMPVLVTSGRNDDTVPYDQAREMARSWCRLGAKITFRTNNLPPVLPGTTIANHFGPEIIDGYFTNGAIAWLTDRLNGIPPGNCNLAPTAR